MKLFKKTTVVLLLAVFTLMGFQSQAKEFSGVIVYNITYGDTDMDAQMMAMMPKTMKLTIKGNMTKTEISMGMGKTIVIFNSDDKTGVTLMDIMGQKFAMMMNAEDIEEELNEAPDTEVVYFDETLEIAGYTCKKAVVIIKSENGIEGVEQTVYYTEELGSGMLNSNNPMFVDINGVMLQYAMSEETMNMQFTAISVEKKRLSDKDFETPEGYKEISKEELGNMFGGGM